VHRSKIDLSMSASLIGRLRSSAFRLSTDPVQLGYVSSLNRPTGNVAGVTFFTGPLGAKRLQLLRELVPAASGVGMLVNPSTSAEPDVADVQTAARTLGWDLHILNASTERDIDLAFATLAPQRIEALVIATDPFYFSLRDKLVALAARSKDGQIAWSHYPNDVARHRRRGDRINRSQRGN
jgi:putative tryptophan/tyrosine transport system substrate-binding protein